MWQVTGILFESKVDYTTWSGDNVEYIHGIQMITPKCKAGYCSSLASSSLT